MTRRLKACPKLKKRIEEQGQVEDARNIFCAMPQRLDTFASRLFKPLQALFMEELKGTLRPKSQRLAQMTLCNQFTTYRLLLRCPDGAKISCTVLLVESGIRFGCAMWRRRCTLRQFSDRTKIAQFQASENTVQKVNAWCKTCSPVQLSGPQTPSVFSCGARQFCKTRLHVLTNCVLRD